MAKEFFKIVADTLTPGLKAYEKKLGIEKKGSVDFLAKKKLGLQLLNYTVNGSPREPVVWPIKYGVLRGSGSVFVGNEFVGDSKEGGEGTPNKSYSASFDTVTVGFNTAYAKRIHETDWKPGLVSERSGDVGNKVVEKHLQADGKTLTKLYAEFVKGSMG